MEMISFDSSKALGFIPMYSSGISKPQFHIQESMFSSSTKQLNMSSLLAAAANGKEVPVIVSESASIDPVFIAEQETHQIYVQQVRKDIQQKILEAQLVRRNNNGEMESIGSCDPSHFSYGSLADTNDFISGKCPVQDDPDTIPTIREL